MTRQAPRPQMIEMIPINAIAVINPRARNRRQHGEIVDNIEAIGLKRPITVRRRAGDEAPGYDLICGQGRLEAMQMLGETEIPAVVTDAAEDDCLVMSLVENIARRQHRPIDIMREIGSLHERGYSDGEIADKLGYTPSWINMVVSLLERGEERLVAAVESGHIPISLAIEIAKAESAEAQKLLLEAYQAGDVKGRKLARLRRMLDRRAGHKRHHDRGLGPRARTLSASDLVRIYQREAEKQRILVKKSDCAQGKLMFIVTAFRELLADPDFVTTLKVEGLDTMPRMLSERIAGRAA